MSIEGSATISLEPDGQPIMTVSEPRYFRDARGGGILLGFFSVPESVPKGRMSYFRVVVTDVRRTSAADFSPCLLEVKKVSDL